jgi:hypothetical protein
MLAARCSECNQDALIWAHRGDADRHKWANENESSCSCQPHALCGVCDVAVLRGHGFLLLDTEAFPSDKAEWLLN